MSEFSRTTTECSVSQLRPELFQAIQLYASRHELGDVEAETLICCETVSQKKSQGRLPAWLGGQGDTIVYTGTLLTPEWLIWARSGDRSGVALSAARLMNIQVKAYISPLTLDSGLEISGYLENMSGRVRGYIGLGDSPAAEKLCAVVREAVVKVNPPSKKLFGWRMD